MKGKRQLGHRGCCDTGPEAWGQPSFRILRKLRNPSFSVSVPAFFFFLFFGCAMWHVGS